jgi:hypothetical protein
MKRLNIIFILAIAGMVLPLAAQAQTVSGKGINAGDTALSVVAPEVGNLESMLDEITTITEEVIACSATGQLVDGAGGCQPPVIAIDVKTSADTSVTVPDNRLYIQGTDGVYQGNSGSGVFTTYSSSAPYFNLRGNNGQSTVVPFQ